MDFEQLLGLPLWVPAGMLAGLILSICFRRRPWVPLIWMPTTLWWVISTRSIILAVLHVFSLRGLDAGWGHFGLVLLLPALAVCLLGVILCLVFQSFGNWNRRAVVAAIGLSAAGVGFLHWRSECEVLVRVVDAQGAVVADVKSSSRDVDGGNEAGTLHFKLQRGARMGFGVSRESAAVPVFYHLELRRSPADRGSIEVRHKWTRTVGYDTKLDESFAEILSYRKRIVISVTLPSGNDLLPVPDRDRFRKVFDSIKRAPARYDLSYGDVCGNLATVDFIPDLISGGRGHRSSNVEGLKQIAETLRRLDEGCWEVRKRIGSNAYHAPDMGMRGNLARLCEWAGVPFGPTAGAETLDQVERKLAERARPLVDFCLQEDSGDDRAPFILSELGTLNRMYLEEFVARLLETPPADMRQAAQWSHVFHRMEARKSELKPLIESPNPLLQAAAKGARPD